MKFAAGVSSHLSPDARFCSTYSINRLWMRSSYMSQVLEPSPHYVQEQISSKAQAVLLDRVTL